MEIFGIISICPECRRMRLSVPDDDGTVSASPLYCADDGYIMKDVKITGELVDRMLIDQVGRCQ